MGITTLRKELTDLGFDFANGRMILQTTGEYSWEVDSSEMIDASRLSNHPILDKSFSCGYGGAEMPRFIAEDYNRIYFPGTYDGATWVEAIFKDITKYMDFKNHNSPYVGGG